MPDWPIRPYHCTSFGLDFVVSTLVAPMQEIAVDAWDDGREHVPPCRRQVFAVSMALPSCVGAIPRKNNVGGVNNMHVVGSYKYPFSADAGSNVTGDPRSWSIDPAARCCPIIARRPWPSASRFRSRQTCVKHAVACRHAAQLTSLRSLRIRGWVLRVLAPFARRPAACSSAPDGGAPSQWRRREQPSCCTHLGASAGWRRWLGHGPG